MLPGHERGNPGYRQAFTSGPPRQSSTLLGGGSWETWPTVEVGTHTATERADMVTLHLRDARARVLPDESLRTIRQAVLAFILRIETPVVLGYGSSLTMHAPLLCLVVVGFAGLRIFIPWSVRGRIRGKGQR